MPKLAGGREGVEDDGPRVGEVETEPAQPARQVGLVELAVADLQLTGRGAEVAREQQAQRGATDDVAGAVALKPVPVGVAALVGRQQNPQPRDLRRRSGQRVSPDVHLISGQGSGCAGLVRLTHEGFPHLGSQHHARIVKASGRISHDWDGSHRMRGRTGNRGMAPHQIIFRHGGEGQFRQNRSRNPRNGITS